MYMYVHTGPYRVLTRLLSMDVMLLSLKHIVLRLVHGRAFVRSNEEREGRRESGG